VVRGENVKKIEEIQTKIDEIFKGIVIRPEYSTESIQITDYEGNRKMDDFKVEYVIGSTKYVFHYPERLSSDLAEYDIREDRLEQLEDELMYVKRMLARGMGAKDYHPLTHIEQ
jgi:5-methylcytosine-specific restriction enzyme subunit McrC